MNCEWKECETDAKGRKVFRCQREGCPNALYAASAEACHANCRATCRFKGAKVRDELVTCKKCRGNVKIKYPIFGCEIHGECHSASIEIAGVMRCSCPDFERSK